jgi:uncharacterized protein
MERTRSDGARRGTPAATQPAAGTSGAAVGAGVGVLVGGGAVRDVARGTTAFHLATLDLDDCAATSIDEHDDRSRAIELAFMAHGMTQSPHDPRRFVLFEKHGPGCCVVELELADGTGAVVHTVAPGRGRQFYGHGVFTADGSALLCTETDTGDHNRGVIAVRDAHDFRLLGEFPSYGRAPHDCLLVDGGATLMISNGGGPSGEPDPPCVTWVDVASQQLRERCELADALVNAGHLAVTGNGDVAVVSAPRDGLAPERSRGGIALRRAGGALVSLSEPREILDALLGETLSVVIHEPTGTVGATTPLANLVTFWRLGDGALVHKLRVPMPRGIALSLDGDEFVINFGTPPRVARVDARTLLAIDAPGNRRGYLSRATGSHVSLLPVLASGG